MLTELPRFVLIHSVRPPCGLHFLTSSSASPSSRAEFSSLFQRLLTRLVNFSGIGFSSGPCVPLFFFIASPLVAAVDGSRRSPPPRSLRVALDIRQYASGTGGGA